VKHFPSPDIGMFGRRQRHVRGHRVPVTITRSAFAELGGVAAIVDDFGKDEVPSHDCPCCTVRGKLARAVRGRMRGGHFNRVTIQTAGDVGPILRTFATARGLGAEFYVDDAPPIEGTHFNLTEDAPLPWNAFSRFMATLMALRGSGLLHVTGLLNIAECRGPVAVQFVQHLVHAPVELQAWPDENRTSRLAFTTRGIEQKIVRDLFDAVRALA
jgi:G3E family GTPase